MSKIVFLYGGQFRTFTNCFHNHIEMLGVPDEIQYYNTENIPNPFEPDTMFTAEETKPNNVFNMWNNWANYKISLYESNVYVFLRPDLIINEPVQIDRNMAGKDCIIPKGHDYRNGINDQMAICGRDAAIIYSRISGYVETYHIHENILFHPETILKHHLLKHGVNIKRIPITHTIAR